MGRLAALTARQYGAWSTSGPWWPVVDEPQPQVIHSCGLTLKLALTCAFGSRHFSSLHAMSGAHVPSMCPGFGP